MQCADEGMTMEERMVAKGFDVMTEFTDEGMSME